MTEKQNEKTYTSKEIERRIEIYFRRYNNVFQMGQMSFAEYSMMSMLINDIEEIFKNDWYKVKE